MGATERGFHELVREHGVRLVPQALVPGLSNRGHLDEVLLKKASPEALRRLESVFTALGGDSNALASKRATPLRLDFYVPARALYIELDEIQHFTSDRGRTLDAYVGEPGEQLAREYAALVERWSDDADRYRATKPAVDFPPPAGRRAQRAYLDAVRDIAAPELGIHLIRIPAPECDAMCAFKRFRTVTGTWPVVEGGQ